MKFLKKMTSLLSVSVLTASLVASNFSGVNKVNSDAASSTNTDDWLHVCGNEIHDANCKKVWLTGANWFGFNCNEGMFHGLDAGKDFRKIASEFANRGLNCVRVPIATELLVGWMKGTPLKVSSNFANDAPYYVNNPWFLTESGGQMNSMQIFDKCMEMFKEYGIKVIVDIHSAEIDNSGHVYNLWYKGKFTSKDWKDSLVWLADKYKNDDTIIAYDLKNEPHGKPQEAAVGTGAKWDNSKDEHNWKYAAEDCGQAILKANPHALILIEGIEVYPKFENGADWNSPPGGYGAPENYHPGWWGGNLRGVKDFPIEMKSPATGKSQLVYSPHEYGPSVYPQSWFNKNFSLQTLHDDYMHGTWDYLLPDYPLLIGEWGGHMDGKDNQKWMEILRDYMIDNTVHHTFWCLNPNSGDTGGLLDHSWDKWDEEKYALVKPALWQSGGKFIGLDHQIPLGENGMTLTEYYGGSVPTQPKTQATTATDPVTTVSTNETTGTPSNVTYGDINGDKSVTIDDVVMLRLYLFSTAKYPLTEEQQAAARVVVGQTSIQGNCAIVIQDYVVEKIKTLPYAN